MIDSVDVIIRRAGHPDRVVKLADGSTRIGRAEDNDIVLSDVGVSRRHARLVVAPDSVRVEDLGSGNGTYYQGFRVQSQAVEDNDEVIIDPFILKFRVHGVPDSEDQPTEVAQMPAARLDALGLDGRPIGSWIVHGRGLTIGRSEARDVVVTDPAASRHHCSVVPQDGRYVLRDMGSANGVFVNGVRVRDALLSHRDRVRIGNTELMFQLVDSGEDGAQGWPEEEGWAAHELSLPAPERPQAARSSARGAAVLPVMVGLFFAAAAVVLFAVASGLLLLMLLPRPAPVAGLERSAHPPTWTLDLPNGLPPTTIEDLFDQGIEALHAGDNRMALQHFYRALQGDHGNPSAERLSYAAGEFVILDVLAIRVMERNQELAARKARRDALLVDARSRLARTRYPAIAELERDFRDDGVVMAAMRWTPSPVQTELAAQADEAARLANADEWHRAVVLYQDVAARAVDRALRERAEAGGKMTRKELARTVAIPWRLGVIAQVDGRSDEARAELEQVLAVDRDHPSAALRMRVLDAGGPR